LVKEHSGGTGYGLLVLFAVLLEGEGDISAKAGAHTLKTGVVCLEVVA
jgi:hypothetical protein